MMKRIVFILLVPLLPGLLSAQGTLVDTVRVLTDNQINLGTVNDSVSFYGQQGNPKTWKKFRMDSLAVYMQNKIGGGGGITNGNKGDITVSNLGATWTINSGAVTGAKTNFAGISGNPVNLLGAQSNGATDIISVGTGLDLTNGVLTATGGGGGGSGTVISITAGTGLTGGTITTTGTIAADLNTLMELSDTVSLSNRINAKLDTLDGSINGNKTNFSGINGNATRLAGILADGKTDTVQVNTNSGITLSSGVLSVDTTSVASKTWVNNRGFLTAEVDGSVTNEAQTLSATGTTSPVISLSQVSGAGGGSVTLNSSGIVSLNQNSNTITISATDSTTTLVNDSVLVYRAAGVQWRTDTIRTGVNTFSAGTTGLTPSTATRGNVTLAGTLNIANGGTGQQTQQAAINALAGAVTSGQYLRGNGNNIVMSPIQAGDVPTLNQSTTGNAATATALQTGRTIQTNLGSTSSATFDGTTGITPGITGFLGFANGGTGQTSYTDGQLLIGNTATTGLSKATLTAGGSIAVTNGNGSISINVSEGDKGDVDVTNSGTIWKLDTNSIVTVAIRDSAVTGLKTFFDGIDDHATRLLGAHNNGNTDTVRVGGGLSLANGTLRSKQDTMAMIIACSDETTNITATGNPKVTFRTPFAITVTGVKASLTTASSSGNVTVDVKNGNTTILSGFLQVDANQTTSVTSGTQRTVTAPNIASDNEVKIDINAAGTGAKGLKVTILYTRP